MQTERNAAESATGRGADTNRRLRSDAQANLERVRHAARDVFAARGVEATLADVARHAGVGIGTIYRRFPSKEDLIQSLFSSRMGEIVEIAEQALGMPDAWDGLAYFMETTGEMMANDQGLRDLLMNGRIESDSLQQSRDLLKQKIEMLISKAREEGSLRRDFESTDVLTLMFVIQASRDFGGKQAPTLWRRILGFMLDGLQGSRTGHCILPVPALTPDQADAALSSPNCPMFGERK